MAFRIGLGDEAIGQGPAQGLEGIKAEFRHKAGQMIFRIHRMALVFGLSQGAAEIWNNGSQGRARTFCTLLC